MTILDRVEHYETGIGADRLRRGMPILDGDKPVIIADLIHDPDRRQAVVEAIDERRRRRVLYLPYGDYTVDVGVVTQYAVLVPGRRNAYAIHPNHGPRALPYAREYLAQHGGRLVRRDVIPHDHQYGNGYMPVTEWADLETGAELNDERRL